jgi:hypothetical protein
MQKEEFLKQFFDKVGAHPAAEDPKHDRVNCAECIEIQRTFHEGVASGHIEQPKG